MFKLVKQCSKLKNYPINVINAKYCSTPAAVPSATKLSFDDFILQRQHEATRSIVVQVSSEKSFAELYNYCSSYGTIVGAHHYCVRHDDVQHYILLEYENAQQANEAIDSSAYNEELNGVPARSPFLWFRASGKKTLKRHTLNASQISNLKITEGNNIIDNNELNTILRQCSHIDNQMAELYKLTKLNDLGIRLRFLAAHQVQASIAGMFPLANALPFGSSVNGFGKMGCDLDLILRLDQECKGPEAKKKRDSRLVFHTKENLTNGRSQTQRQMESIGDMLQLFLPGVCHVRRILQARVPIIKYHHEHLNLEIDLSMSNLSGFYMSELLYMFGEFDERVRPLTFCIRRWANACGLTNPSPGRWISNFSLTCLVIFFLQQTKQPVLPAINTLIKSATQDDLRITEDGINCTFARDFQNVGFRSKNTSKTSELLLQFFEFYSQYDFQNKAISLNEGRAISKPDHSALYIVNPLEQLLNVSKNVSMEECERLRIEVRNAAWVLESEVENQYHAELEKDQQEPWGLLNIFKNPEKTIIRPNMFFKPRILEVSDLFDKTDLAQPANAVTSTSMGLKNSEVKNQYHAELEKDQQEPWGLLNIFKNPEKTIIRPNMFFKPRILEVSDLFDKTDLAQPANAVTSTSMGLKNSEVKNQIENIKATARQDMKQMRLNATSAKTTQHQTSVSASKGSKRSR